MKQRVTAKTANVRRYKERIKQFRQNKLFQTDQSRLYQELNGDDRSGVSPDKEEAESFWSNIWSKEINHNSSAEWIGEIKEEVGVQEQENIELTADKMEKMAKKMANLKAPGPDLVQGFWLKNFRSMHGRMLIQLNECLNKRNVPNWMTKGRTVLIMKDKDEGNVASNHRPITCLPLMWKLLTGIIAEEMYTFLEREEVLQKNKKDAVRNLVEQITNAL